MGSMMHMNTQYPPLGTVSWGTHRPQDLIASFINVLEEYDHEKIYTDIVDEGKNILESGDVDSEETSWYLNETLWDAMQEIKPPYTYFGACDGDGADFGFWPIFDDDNLSRYADLSDISEDEYNQDVYIINDHGNCSCGYIDSEGEFHFYWSIV